MRNALVFTFIFTLFHSFSNITSVDYGCSIFCKCDKWFGLKRAICTNQRLYSVETGVSSGVEAIDLSNNSISSLSNYQLAAAGLTKLRYLNLSGNGINEINLAAFAKLNELAVLDLSKNHLNYLLVDTFVLNLKLKILKLQGNNFNRHFPKLRSSSIIDVDLSSCLISHLPVDAFDSLEQLNNLNLSKNILIQLSVKVLQGVPSLRKISLERNPWACNRVLQELQIYLLSRKVKFTSICELPSTKKLEKMIKLEAPMRKSVDLHFPLLEISTKPENSWDLDLVNNQREDIMKTVNAINITQNLSTSMKSASPYWFIGIGFLLGSTTTLIGIYLWFYTALSCRFLRIPRRNNVGSPSANSQRISLLQNLWLHQDTDADDTSSSACPGTPPPPYREVMLHRNLYPCAR